MTYVRNGAKIFCSTRPISYFVALLFDTPPLGLSSGSATAWRVHVDP
jgi:hypothetical protein